MFGKRKGPWTTGSRTALALSKAHTARTFPPAPGPVYAQYSRIKMPVLGITGWNDEDNFKFAPYQPFPKSSTALQFFQRIWNIFDKADYTYTGGGAQATPQYHWVSSPEHEYDHRVQDWSFYVGTMALNNAVVGPGRCPTVNDYPTAFKRTSTETGEVVEGPPDDYYGNLYNVMHTTIEPDTSVTWSNGSPSYPGTYGGAFDYFRGLGILGMPPNPISTYGWFAGGVEYHDDAFFKYISKAWDGSTVFTYEMQLSNPTDVAALYNRAYDDFVPTVFHPWKTTWGAPDSLGYKMPGQPIRVVDQTPYDGSLVLNPADGSPSLSAPIPANAFAGWDMSNAGPDRNLIRLWRSQVMTNDNKPHFYWIGNFKGNLVGLTANSLGSLPPGTWKMRISFVRSGWMYPGQGEGAVAPEARVEVDFPTSKGWPIPVINGAPVTTEYNFIVVDQTPDEWLAANAAAFPNGFGDYTYGGTAGTSRLDTNTQRMDSDTNRIDV